MFGIDIERLLVEYEAWVYPLTFLWTFLEGETFVLFAGYAVHLGHLDFTMLVLSAWGGSFAGDQLYFFLGRRYGRGLKRRFPRWGSRADGALALLERYDALFILSFRFIYGVRNVSSFACGLSQVHWRRFFVLNFIAAGLWSLSFVGIGYLFGQAMHTFLPDLARYRGLPMLAAFIVLVWLLLRAQSRRKQAAAGPVAPPPEPAAASEGPTAADPAEARRRIG